MSPEEKYLINQARAAKGRAKETGCRHPPFDPTRYAELIANPGTVSSLGIESRMTWALLVAQRRADAEESGWFGWTSGRSRAQLAAHARRRAAK